MQKMKKKKYRTNKHKSHYNITIHNKIKKTASLHNLEKAAWNKNYNKNQREFTNRKSTLDNI